MDRIVVNGARLTVHLGVPPHERAVEQEIVVDLEVGFDTRKAGRSDHFDDTIDYAALHETARRAATARPYSLVESMAEEIAAALLAQFPIESARVVLKKPGALRKRGVEWAGVEIERRRGD